jgi:exonuclease III
VKILTWNLERLQKNSDDAILQIIERLDADVLILTETSSRINPGKHYNGISTENLEKGFDGIDYKAGENRTSIWTKYPIKKQHTTFDKFTSICAEVETDFGLLNIYGTIIGIFGGKGERFKNDFEAQIKDFEKISNNICIAGDLNITLSGYVYPSHSARKRLNELLQKKNLNCLTSEIVNNVDHIILNNNFIRNRKVEIIVWNQDKKLSDHIGICLSLE